MRLCSRNLKYEVIPLQNQGRRVQMRIGSLHYTLTYAEAIELANNLTDTVEQSQEGNTDE